MIPASLFGEKNDLAHEAKAIWQFTNLKLETINSHVNYDMLNAEHEKGRAKCLSEMPKVDHEPAIIVGSGSSLDGVVAELKDWKGAIFCSTSHGTTLVYHGRPPDVFACFDPRTAPFEFAVPPHGWDKTVYLAHVSCPPEYFKEWTTRSRSLMYIYRILEPTYDWYSHHLIWAWPWVRRCMLPFIDSIASMISLAAGQGYDPLYLIGVDYGGHRFEQHYFDGKDWIKVDGVEYGDKVGPGGLRTDDQMLFSMRGLTISGFLQMFNLRQNTRIFQMSYPTNAKCFPRREWKDVLLRQGKNEPEWTPETKEAVGEKIEIELAKSNTFIIPVEGGFGTDYRVMLADPAHLRGMLFQLSSEILDNRDNFMKIEKATGKRISDHIRDGSLLIQKGEILTHSYEELADFDCRKMHAIDVERVSERLMHIKKVSDISDGA